MSNEIKGIVRPPLPMPPDKGERRNYRPKVKTPLLITLFAWLCFFRAVVYLVFALIVGLAPDSEIANYLATHFDSVPREVSPEAVFFISSGLYGLIGWRWYSRDWRARWVAMFFAGASVARTVVLLLADRASGVDTPLTQGEQFALMASSTFNLLIFLYLAFYPGMDQAFRETPWE